MGPARLVACEAAASNLLHADPLLLGGEGKAPLDQARCVGPLTGESNSV